MDIAASFKDLRKVFLVLVFLLVFFIMLAPPRDADMWWHLSAGREMAHQGRILTTDIFSYTRHGEPWTNAFWLSDLVLFLAYKLGCYLGITILVASIAVLAMAVIYLQTSHNPYSIPLFVILLAAFAIAPVWTPRPQIFSFLLLAILDYGLNRRNGFILKRAWLLVPIFILWANTHGGFIWGFLLMSAFILGSRFDYLLKREDHLSTQSLARLGFWTSISALAISINPNGFSLWKLPFYTVGISIRSITEWGSPDFHRPDLHPILWLLFLLMIGLGTSKKASSWSDILKTIGFSYMAFISQRSIGPFVIIATPVVIDSLRDVWLEWLPLLSGSVKKLDNPRRSNPLPLLFAATLNVVILGTFAFVTILRADSVSTHQQAHNGFPLKAVEWIRVNRPNGRMFNAYNWGGYLQWELPDYPVFIDGRADLYGEEIISDWWSVVNATDESLALLDYWQVNFVLLERGWPMEEKLTQSGWRVLYEDDTAVIISR